MNKVRRVLTNSRIDNIYIMYKILKEEFDERKTDEIDKDELFKIIMKKSKGILNPQIIKQELDLI